MSMDELPLQDLEISKVTSWPDPVFFVHNPGDSLPLRYRVQHRLVCLAFEIEADGNEWKERTKSHVELLPASKEQCRSILSAMRNGGVPLVWMNASATVDAPVLHEIEGVLVFLNQATASE